VLFMVVAQGDHGAVTSFCALFDSSEDGKDFMEVMRRLCVSSPFWTAVDQPEHRVDVAEPNVPQGLRAEDILAKQGLCAEDILPNQIASLNFFLACVGIKTMVTGTNMHLAEVGCTSYISAYGYTAQDEDVWHVTSIYQPRPELSRPTFQVKVRQHAEIANHTWYFLEGSLLLDRPPHRLDWLAPRRLTHIRQYLHDPVRAASGDEYNKHSGKVGFAQRMGPRGTTKRLGNWLSALAVTINSRTAPPRVVALTLHFLETPCLSANIDDGLGFDEPELCRTPTEHHLPCEEGTADGPEECQSPVSSVEILGCTKATPRGECCTNTACVTTSAFNLVSEDCEIFSL